MAKKQTIKIVVGGCVVLPKICLLYLDVYKNTLQFIINTYNNDNITKLSRQEKHKSASNKQKCLDTYKTQYICFLIKNQALYSLYITNQC